MPDSSCHPASVMSSANKYDDAMFLLFESYMAGLGLTFLAHCASLQIVTIGRTDAKERIIARANALYLQ